MGRIFNVQDTAIVEGCGAIVDRSQEFLGASDRAIIAARRQVLNAIRQIQSEQEPPNVKRSEAANHYSHLTVVSEVIADGTDWRTYWRKKLAEAQL